MATSVPVPEKNLKLRSLCFTVNNYTETDVKVLRAMAPQCRYLVFGYEVAPTTNTPHLQGYVAWVNPRSVNKFCSMFSKRPHTEKTRGTPKQASDYCKEDGKFEEFGELPEQGSRTDWATAVTQLSGGAEITQVIEEQPQLLPCIRALERYKAMTLKPKHREVNVHVLIGDAGTGKTRWAYDNYPELYSKPRGDWWDGYTGQTAILLDDYYGYIPYCELLRVLDRYPYQVPVKGGYVQAQWDTVIITSNRRPEEWYAQGMTPALARRLKNNFLVSSIDGETIFTPFTPSESPQGTSYRITR